MNRNTSTILGVLVSPLALFIVPITMGIQTTDFDWQKAITDYLTFIYPIALGGVVLVGMPAYLLLRHFGHANYITLVSAGGLGGAAFGALATPVIYSMLFYAGCGLVVASIFWFLVVHQPNKAKSSNKSFNPDGSNNVPPG